jgi:glutamyl-tRNA synthetase
LHLGNASSALLAWLSIRSRGGSFVMRMEDLDRNRVRPGLAERILDDLTWLGLDWDEGPNCGGSQAPYEQWARLDRYQAAFERLRDAGNVYPCFCSRKDVAAAASAPQAPGDEVRYPGTCSAIDPGQAAERVASGARHAWRFRVAPGQIPTFIDLVRGPYGDDRVPGDFVVFRADAVPAYQLAVVVDDAAMGINEVVRGDDLLPSTTKQLLLIEALALDIPVYGHVPLLLGPDGIRLSKRHRGVTLRELRERGAGPEGVVGRLAHLLGLRAESGPASAADLIDGFRLSDLQAAPDGIVVDTAGW